RLHALLESRTRRDDIDLDAGILGEGVEQRLDQLGFAIGVDVDFAVGGRRRGSECGEAKQRCRCGERARIQHDKGTPAGMVTWPDSVAQRLARGTRRYVANALI